MQNYRSYWAFVSVRTFMNWSLYFNWMPSVSSLRLEIPDFSWPCSRQSWEISTSGIPWSIPLQFCPNLKVQMQTLGSGWTQNKLLGSAPSTPWVQRLVGWGPWCSMIWLDGSSALWRPLCHPLLGRCQHISVKQCYIPDLGGSGINGQHKEFRNWEV